VLPAFESVNPDVQSAGAPHVCTTPLYSPGMKIRRVRESDTAEVRRLRLASLADAPDAFAATLEEALAAPESHWAERVRSNAQAIANVAYLAEADNGADGWVIGVWRGGEPATAVLNALWVAPHARGRGVGRALVRAVEAWAVERGAVQIELEVTVTSHAARALYTAEGYEATEGPQAVCGARRASATKLHKRLV
jgi:ribosomal protein S18 acetylase RimI-like enzyme